MTKNSNLYLCLAKDRFKHAADRPFLIVPGKKPLLYSELDAASGRIQSRLMALGVTAGERVMVQVEKSIDAVTLYLACLRCGAVYIPLNSAYTSKEVEYFMGDAEPRVFVCSPTKFSALQAVAIKIGIPHLLSLDNNGEGSLLDAVHALDPEPAVVHRNGNDLAAILYTSGTTGRSKGAMLSHANLQSNAEVLHRYWHWRDGRDVLLHALPVFHVHGLFIALHCALLGASPVYFLSRFATEEVIDCMPSCTVMMGVPTFYTRLLDCKDFSAETCANMRLFISGSAPLLAETHHAFKAKTGHQILERYGMTETGMITSNPYHGERLPGSVGFALPGVKVRITDQQGQELPCGETGVLEVKGDNVFQGYWRMPEKTRSEFRDDGWFISGDMATMDDSGRVTLVGRAKDLIISGGYNVYPSEVEREIDAIAGVKECAVIGVSHVDFGEGVVAVIVPDGKRELTESDIIDALQGNLARFKQPGQVYFVDELPRNSMGKVQKALLREIYNDTFSPESRLDSAQNTATNTKQAIEQRIRNGIPISAHMDFRVLELSDHRISVRTGGDENINVHGTAFAGSLYTTCALALWGLIDSRLPANASLVMASAEIRYLKPVVGDIVSICDIGETEMNEFLQAVNERGKGRLQAQVYVLQNNIKAVEFTGTVYARLKDT